LGHFNPFALEESFDSITIYPTDIECAVGRWCMALSLIKNPWLALFDEGGVVGRKVINTISLS
jgi:hypothetical protein